MRSAWFGQEIFLSADCDGENGAFKMIGEILRCQESAEQIGVSIIGKGRAWRWCIKGRRTRNWTGEQNGDSLMILSEARVEGRAGEWEVIAAIVALCFGGLDVSHGLALAEQGFCFKAINGQLEGGWRWATFLKRFATLVVCLRILRSLSG